MPNDPLLLLASNLRKLRARRAAFESALLAQLSASEVKCYIRRTGSGSVIYTLLVHETSGEVWSTTAEPQEGSPYSLAHIESCLR
jgi:hypothetical protein